MDLAGQSFLQARFQLSYPTLKIPLRLPTLSGEYVESSHCQCRCQQNAGQVGGRAGYYRDHDRTQAKGSGLSQCGGGKRTLDLVGDGPGFRLTIVAPYDLAGDPTD